MLVTHNFKEKKWCFLFFFAKHPPSCNKIELFGEISAALILILNEYDDIVLAGDLNIDHIRPKSDSSDSFPQLSNVFSLPNLVKETPCVKLKKKPLSILC